MSRMSTNDNNTCRCIARRLIKKYRKMRKDDLSVVNVVIWATGDEMSDH